MKKICSNCNSEVKIKKDIILYCPYCGVELDKKMDENTELPETDIYRQGFMDGIRFMKDFIEVMKKEKKIDNKVEVPQIIKIVPSVPFVPSIPKTPKRKDFHEYIYKEPKYPNYRVTWTTGTHTNTVDNNIDTVDNTREWVSD